MSEPQVKQKVSPRHAIMSRAGVRYYIRTVSSAARQTVISIPPEIRKEAELWRGRMVYMWVVKGVVMIKPMKQDILDPTVGD